MFSTKKLHEQLNQGMKLKEKIRNISPKPLWFAMARVKKKIKDYHFQHVLRTARKVGLDVYPIHDFYSPLPSLESLKKNLRRWCKSSELVGIQYDIEAMKTLFKKLEEQYTQEFKNLKNYNEYKTEKYGPGFPEVDAVFLYYMVRDIKPKNYIEIGSGLSTKYCLIAAEKNAETGKPVNITCIDPYPYDNLYDIPQIEIVEKEVQSVDVSFFEKLDAGDILCIDSTHAVKIDGDVPFLYLEVIPRLKQGVFIQIHDVPFPYNVPFPQDLHIFTKNLPEWPWFFTEAMMLQAFLSYNESYQIVASIPLLRHLNEEFLCRTISSYRTLSEYTIENLPKIGFPPCSIWIKKVK